MFEKVSRSLSMIQIFFSFTNIWTPQPITSPRSRCACGVTNCAFLAWCDSGKYFFSVLYFKYMNNELFFCFCYILYTARGIIRLALGVTVFYPLFPLLCIVFLAFSVCSSPYLFLFHLHSFLLFFSQLLPISLIFLSALHILSLSLSQSLSLSCSVSSSLLLFFSVSVFPSLSLFPFVCLPFVLSFFLSKFHFYAYCTLYSSTFFHVHVYQLRMLNMFVWVVYGCRSYDQSSFLLYRCF